MIALIDIAFVRLNSSRSLSLHRYVAKSYPSSRSPWGTFTYWEHKDHFRGLGASPVGLAILTMLLFSNLKSQTP